MGGYSRVWEAYLGLVTRLRVLGVEEMVTIIPDFTSGRGVRIDRAGASNAAGSATPEEFP